MTKTIMILEMGPMADELKPKYGVYTDMFKELLEDDELEFVPHETYAGEPLPDVHAADGYVFSGSKHGVYENLPWMVETEEFIRKAAEARMPMVGICFGHQIMAKALGGEVIKSPKGWGLGVQEYDVLPNDQLAGAPKSMRFNAVHQDQVIKKPEDAEVFASSDFCEYAGLVYGGSKPYAISLQPHPEFGKEFTEDLIAVRRGSAFPQDKSDEALKSQSQDINNDDWGRLIVDFLKR